MATESVAAEIRSDIKARTIDRPHAIYPSLFGKTVLITGGAQGIGAAAVGLFARQKCKVIIFDLASSLPQFESLSTVITNQNLINPVFYAVDVKDIPMVQTTAARVLQDHGPVHVLINNAAAVSPSAIQAGTLNLTAELWDSEINTNLRHYFFLAQALLPSMISHYEKTGEMGNIINMGSISWRIPATGIAAYTTAKAGIMGLTRTLAKEFGPKGVRVNSIMPGAIATDRQITQVLTEEYRKEVWDMQSLKRDLIPDEVARVMVFLASEEASAVSGANWCVDGGWCSDP